jgi:GT2 family glycosyltransferase
MSDAASPYDISGSAAVQEQPCNADVGVVVIGRNEGERLRRCLESVSRVAATVVYVDSGSSDGSVALARSFGVDVLELDLSTPFCAARARNEGCARLLSSNSNLKFIQFVDGDCEIIGDWLSVAAGTLKKNPEMAIVAGYLHERYPERSIYNRLGNLEWNFSSPGEVESVGGIFMIKKEVFEDIGGFDDSIPAGEEPELCSRIRKRSWKIQRLGHKMAWHDLAMTHFSQWWMRMIRYGYGSSDVGTRFDLPGFSRNNLRARIWFCWLALVAVSPAFIIVTPFENMAGHANWLIFLLISLWPAQVARISVRTWQKGIKPELALAYGFFIMLSYWPQMIGQGLYFIDRVKKRSFRLLEYKTTR